MNRISSILLVCILAAVLTPGIVHAETLKFTDGATAQATLIAPSLRGLECKVDGEHLVVKWRYFDYEEVVRLWIKSNLKSDPQVIYELGRYCYLNKRYADAKEYLEKAGRFSKTIRDQSEDLLAEIKRELYSRSAQSLADRILDTFRRVQAGSGRKKALEGLYEIRDKTVPDLLDTAIALTAYGTRDKFLQAIEIVETEYYTSIGWKKIDGEWMSTVDARSYREAMSKDSGALKEKHKAFLKTVFGEEAIPSLHVVPGRYVVLFADYVPGKGRVDQMDNIWGFCRDTLGAVLPKFEPQPVALFEGRNSMRAYLKKRGITENVIENIYVHTEGNGQVTYSYVDEYRLARNIGNYVITKYVKPFHKRNAWVRNNLPMLVEFALGPQDWLPRIKDRVRGNNLEKLEKVMGKPAGSWVNRRSSGKPRDDFKKDSVSFLFFLAFSPKYRGSFGDILKQLQEEDWRFMFPLESLPQLETEWKAFYK